MDFTKRMDHVAIAVWSARRALTLYRDVLGGVYFTGGEDEELKFRWMELKMPGGFNLELVEPTAPDSFLYSFLEKRGEGPHHITFRVDDIYQTMAALREAGYDPIMTRLQNSHWEEAFVHPKQAHGVLLQFAASDLDEDTLIAAYQIDLDALPE